MATKGSSPRQGELPTDNRYVVYRWLTSEAFLLPAIVPGATVLEAAVDEAAGDILARIPVDSGAFHFHLNCTHTDRFPLARAELVRQLRARGIPIINSALTDISKRAIQRACVELGLNTTTAPREGDPDELLIVKTDLNFGGDSEWALTLEERAAVGAGEGSQLIWKPDHYQVLPRKELEESWWTDPTLVREKYIDNRHDRWYRAFLLLSRMALCEFVDPSQIKKVGHSTASRVWLLQRSDVEASEGDTPYPRQLVRDLLRFAGAFAIDFAAVDIVVSDAGQAYIIDVNSTPAYNYPVSGLVEYLRGGLALSYGAGTSL